MLRRLTVDNYALIAHLEMELGAGLNIVTGETGAGKSILMGALGLLLGTRGEAGVQGDPGRNCVVEGVFEVGADAGSGASGLRDFFEANDLEWAPEVVVRRILSVGGKSRAYIGDLPVTLAVLRALGERLIDIHSQHENLLLRGAGFRTSIVDVAAGQIDLVAQYSRVFGEWRALERQLRDARAEAAAARGDEDFLRHQTDELAALKLRAGEQTELETELRGLEHADEIREAIGLCTSELAADETGILPRLKALRQATERIAKIHPPAEEFASRLGSTYLELQDLERELSADLERADGDPERLETVSARLDAIWTLERKHRVETVEELLALQREFEARLAAIDNSDETLRALESRTAARFSDASELAARISAGRRKASKAVSAHVEGTLRRLGMPETTFIVDVSPAGGGGAGTTTSASAESTGGSLASVSSETPSPSSMRVGESTPAGSSASAGSMGSTISPAAGAGATPPSAGSPSGMGAGDGKASAVNLRADGADEVRFLFSANPGMAPRAVEKIASGGEVSRVMLALKTLSVKALGQPTVVFDEIDAGVSGRVADAMGEVIAELSATCQVVNITHLPQIAAKPGEHFVVYKEGGATKIRRLDAAERTAEIAKMLSGTTVTDAALSQARELLG